MGLFSRNKQKSLTDWLNEVDESYRKAFKCGQVQALGDYFSRPLAQSIRERINAGERDIYSGLDRYRHTTWKKKSSNSKPAYIKIVTYDHIKVSKGIVAPVGDDYKEEWILSDDNGIRIVESIRRLEA